MTATSILKSLAQNAEDEALVKAVLAKAKPKGELQLVFGKRTLSFGEPATDAAKYKAWPKSFQALIKKTSSIRIGDALVIGDDANGGLDGLE